jgi:phenylacetate-CoA ligase
MIGDKIEQYYKEFHGLYDNSFENNKSFQMEKLDRILVHSIENVEFYRARVSSNRPVLSDFPIVTKAALNDNFTVLMADSLRRDYSDGKRKRFDWLEVKTGGSTGVPTSVIHDKQFRTRGRASRLFSQYLCQFPLSTPYLKIWGSMKEINQEKESPEKRVSQWLLNTQTLNAFRMSDDQMNEYVQFINASQYDHIMAYVDAVYQLASFIKKNNLKIKPIKSIMGCAGTVTEDYRTAIEGVFDTKLHNKYGSRDCTDMACECREGNIHIFDNHVYVEIIDKSGNPLEPGKTGRIVITLLNNPSFPLIRYEIGDMGSIASHACECGLHTSLFNRIEGRISEFIKDTKGNLITPVYFRHLIGVVNGNLKIKRFQLIQNGEKSYTLLIESAGEILMCGNETDGIRSDLLAVLGNDAKLKINVVNTIEEASSGKFQYVKNNYIGV